jgi:hypothetical protein
MLVLSGFADGEIRDAEVSWSHDGADGLFYELQARGELAFAWDTTGNAYVIDASDASAPEATRIADHLGWVRHVELTDDQAICSLGPYGAATVNLDP